MSQWAQKVPSYHFCGRVSVKKYSIFVSLQVQKFKSFVISFLEIPNLHEMIMPLQLLIYLFIGLPVFGKLIYRFVTTYTKDLSTITSDKTVLLK